MILSPEQYAGASVYVLMAEAERGYVPLDQRLIRTLVGRGDSVFPDFVRALGLEPQEDLVDIDEFMLDVARHMRTPASLPFLAAYARQYEFEFPDELTEAFAELGAASIETLLTLYEESKRAPDVGFTLAGLGVLDPRIAATITERLRDDPAEAVSWLTLYGDPAARADLEKAASECADEDLRRELEATLRDLDEGREEAHVEPFDITSLYPEEDTPFFSAFERDENLEFLKSPVPDYRLRAVKMLTFEDVPPEIARRVLEVAQSDPDTGVRAVAWECLEAVDEPAEIPKTLRERLDDATAPVAERAGALVALAPEVRNDEALRRLVLEFYEKPEARERAVRAMWHSGDRRFESRVAEAIGDPDLGVRREGVTGAGMFGLVGQLGRIEKLFSDEQLRPTALYAYALAAPGQVTPSRMRGIYERIEELADGLDEDEQMLVGKALDDRLEAHDQPPVFHTHDDEGWSEDAEDEAPAAAPKPVKVGRNDPCPCGSGKKYKKCCGQ